ncbi:MAG: TraR/DksA C4-type zinc finger protein [Pseudomonadota bacterium]
MRKVTFSVIFEVESRLRAQRDEIVARIRDSLCNAEGSEVPSWFHSLAKGPDAADTALFDEAAFSFYEHDLSSLRDIDAALKRIDFGLSGTCVECGEAIPAERMLAVPTTSTCVACQQLIEGKRPKHVANIA